MRAVHLEGQRFGRLVALSRAPTLRKKTRWLCRCDCGAEKVIWRDALAGGHAKSCGCLNSELTARRNYKHGKAWTRVWRIWNGMIRRCTDPKHTRWEWYGGRGIKVCDRWRVFVNFYADMGEPPTDEHSIERVDVNGNYEPSNCMWLPLKEQAKNRRPRKRKSQ